MKGHCSQTRMSGTCFKAPAIVRNQYRLSLKCAATGIPPLDITLYSSDVLQKIEANGVNTTYFTSITMNQIYSADYHCNVSTHFWWNDKESGSK